MMYVNIPTGDSPILVCDRAQTLSVLVLSLLLGFMTS